MHEKTAKKILKLKLNKKTVESLNDDHLERVSGGSPSFYPSGCVSIRTACCGVQYTNPAPDTSSACGACL